MYESDLLEAYNTGGKSAVSELIKSTYAPYKDIIELYGVNYYDTAVAMSEAEFENILIYEENGCLNNGQISYSCLVEKDVRVNNADSTEVVVGIHRVLQTVLSNSEDDLYSGIFGLKTSIYEEVEQYDVDQ